MPNSAKASAENAMVQTDERQYDKRRAAVGYYELELAAAREGEKRLGAKRKRAQANLDAVKDQQAAAKESVTAASEQLAQAKRELAASEGNN